MRLEINPHIKFAFNKNHNDNFIKALFLNKVDNEVHAPLHSIVELVTKLGETELTQEQRYFVDLFKKTSTALRDNFNDILDISKIQKGYLKLDFKEFDLEELVADIFKLMSINAIKKSLVLKIEIDENLPKKIIIDPHRFRQIISHILNYAINFTHSGELTFKMYRLAQSASETQICCTLKNTSSNSIISANKNKISDSFIYEIESPNYRKKLENSGLGLIISKSLAHLMGGNLSIENIKNDGSIFNFSFKSNLSTQNISIKDYLLEKSFICHANSQIVLLIGFDGTENLFLSTLKDLGMTVLILKGNDNPFEIINKFKKSLSYIFISESNPDLYSTQSSDNSQLHQYSLFPQFEQSRDLLSLLKDVVEDNQVKIVGITNDDDTKKIEFLKNYGISAFYTKPFLRNELIAELKNSNIFQKNKIHKNLENSDDLFQVSSKQFKVLIVENKKSDNFILKKYLDYLPLDFESVNCNELNLQTISINDFDLILIDLIENESLTIECARKIDQWKQIKKNSSTKLVAIVSDLKQNDPIYLSYFGFNDYVIKPFSAQIIQKLFLTYYNKSRRQLSY